VFLWLPRRFAPALPAVVALGFFLTWLPLQLWIHSFARVSAASYTTGIGATSASWIDDAVGRDADVTLVWTGDNPYRGWENEFWNRSVRRAYDVGAPPLVGGADELSLVADPKSGRLTLPGGEPVRVAYVLAPGDLQIVGERVAADVARQMFLYRVDGVLRSATTIHGWEVDYWTGPRVEWTGHACSRGSLRIPVASDGNLFRGVTQTIAVSGTTPKPFTVRLPSTQTKTIVVPLVPEGGVCHVRLAVSPTRRPVDYPALGNDDRRRLGVRVTGFQYVPAP
jgi:hypothetical protein